VSAVEAVLKQVFCYLFFFVFGVISKPAPLLQVP